MTHRPFLFLKIIAIFASLHCEVKSCYAESAYLLAAPLFALFLQVFYKLRKDLQMPFVNIPVTD